MPDPVLKPCPFCQSENLTLRVRRARAWVVCYECDTKGPVGEGPQCAEAAARKWNERPREQG